MTEATDLSRENQIRATTRVLNTAQRIVNVGIIVSALGGGSAAVGVFILLLDSVAWMSDRYAALNNIDVPSQFDPSIFAGSSAIVLAGLTGVWLGSRISSSAESVRGVANELIKRENYPNGIC